MSEKICMSCMNTVVPGAVRCPSCGFDGSQQNPEIALPIGTRLNDRYVAGRMTDSDGDSAYYAGYDVQLAKKVEIREFLPINGCSRSRDTFFLIPKAGAELHFKTSLMDFTDLYKNLCKLTYEDGLVRTLDYFECNQTAYAILEDFEAMTLKEFLGLRNGVITWEQCKVIMEPVFNAVNSVHSVNLTHRGVCPDTILVSRTGEIKLSGFATTSVRTKGTDVACKLFSGYSAPEQYSASMWHSAATDVYGLAATVYRCVTGTVPQEADQRRVYDSLAPADQLNYTVPPEVSKAVMLAMLIDPQARTGTVLGFKQSLAGRSGRPAKTRISAGEENAVRPGAKPKRPAAAVPGVSRETDSRERLVRVVFIISAAFFALMLTVYLILRLIKPDVSSGVGGNPTAFSDSVTVPDYAGKMLGELDGKLDTYNFTIKIETVYRENEPEGKIMETSPPGGVYASSGDVLTLYVNMQNIVELVDFTGFTKANAELVLEGLGIGKNNYEFKSEETREGYDGTVFKQSTPPGGSFDANKEKLTLTLAVNSEHVDDTLPEELLNGDAANSAGE